MTAPKISDQITEESNYVPFWSLMLIALIFFVVTAKPAGYCKAEKRVFSDEEICIKLLNGDIQNGQIKIELNETNGRTYFLNHPRSCSVDKSAMARFRKYGLIDAMFSDTIGASLSYKMSEKFKKIHSVTGDRTYGDWIDLSPCGVVRNSSGMID